MEIFSNYNIYKRNQPFINSDIQKKLSELNIALIGAGLSSQVAGAFVRLGITKLALWDHDVVSLSNLNRQAFDMNQLDKNKARATAEYISKIHPGLRVEVNERYFEESDLDRLNEFDLVVNSVDFTNSLVYDISDRMQTKGGWCIQPLNLWWNAHVCENH